MTATDKLRQMLDERGVKWDYGITGSTTTRFGVNGIDFTFTPMRDGLVCSTILTPAQAVEATLGRGECKDIGTDRFVCSKCGCTLDLEDAASCEPTMWVDGVAACPRFCPNCGMRVRR